MIPISSSSPAVDREAAAAAAAAAAATSRYDRMSCGGGEVGGYGRVFDYRDHRRVGHSPPHWSHGIGGGATRAARAPWAEGVGSRDARSSLSGAGSAGCAKGSGADAGAQRSDRGTALLEGWRLQSAGKQSYGRHPSASSAPTRAERARDTVGVDVRPTPWQADEDGGFEHDVKPSWASRPLVFTSGASGGSGGGSKTRHRDTGALPSTMAPLQGGGYGRDSLSPKVQKRSAVGVDAPAPFASARDPHWRHSHAPCPSASAADAAVVMNKLSPPASWDLGSGSGGRSGMVPITEQTGGRFGSPGLAGGSRWRDEGGGGGRAYSRSDRDRELYHDAGLPRGSPLGRDRDHLTPSHPQARRPQDFPPQQLRTPISEAGPEVTLPSLGRGGSDPGPFDDAPKPRFSCVSGSAPPRLPGLARAVATAGNAAAGASKSAALGELRASSSGGGGATGVVFGGAAEGGRKQQRRYGAVVLVGMMFTCVVLRMLQARTVSCCASG